MNDLRTIRLGIEAMRGGRSTEGNGDGNGDAAPSGDSNVAWWPHYDRRIFDALYAAYNHVAGPDHDYMSNIEPLREAPIPSASMSDLSTWFTYLMRGDRFDDGLIAAYIEDGRLLQMFERLVEVADPGSGSGR
ncbi:DUF6508 domain-containing protein [Leucobacter sp. wl10]|uniref:DUF6508 domain-containing protein n=1 Tax=Leucobacter sp. wl10 TaxID=2304677 RepID=UPI000E5BFD5D|nr:DUF6508 domain-containing protein [Leucobacter sp. wl10]RGE20087.1 hypothetical protein D1J51_10190 [Leucobacter sp. wl10]